MSNPWLILETSGRAGVVGLAIGDTLLATKHLDGAKRHNRDLIPCCAELLANAGFTPARLAGVIVGVGPGSYTGLRVGLTAAKAYALATGCAVVAVPTFHTLAEQAPSDWAEIEVIADSLQGTLYRQPFWRQDGHELKAGPLEIVRLDHWLADVKLGAGVTGPGAVQFADRLSGRKLAPPPDCQPRPETVWQVGRKMNALPREEWFALEPLYLRGSSAEEKAKLTK